MKTEKKIGQKIELSGNKEVYINGENHSIFTEREILTKQVLSNIPEYKKFVFLIELMPSDFAKLEDDVRKKVAPDTKNPSQKSLYNLIDTCRNNNIWNYGIDLPLDKAVKILQDKIKAGFDPLEGIADVEKYQMATLILPEQEVIDKLKNASLKDAKKIISDNLRGFYEYYLKDEREEWMAKQIYSIVNHTFDDGPDGEKMNHSKAIVLCGNDHVSSIISKLKELDKEHSSIQKPGRSPMSDRDSLLSGSSLDEQKKGVSR